MRKPARTAPSKRPIPKVRDLRYYCNCVNWPDHDVHADGGLCDMTAQARDITRQSFLAHVNRDDLDQLAEQLGYAPHKGDELSLASDWHVSYHKSRLHGRPAYYLRHSGIEYVFTVEGNP